VVAAQLGDLVTFVFALGHAGIRAEDNPIARSLYGEVGIAGPVLLKLAAIVALCAVFRLVFARLPRIALPAVAIAVGLGLLGAAGNVGNGTLL
jgi:hypothetical protein